MSIINCPHCRGQIQNDGSVQGRAACPHCGGQFTLTRAAAPPLPPSAPPRRSAPPQAGATWSAQARTRRRPSSWLQTLMSLLDFKFERYLTPAIVRMSWLMAVILAALSILFLLLGLIGPIEQRTSQLDFSPAATGFSAPDSPVFRWVVSGAMRVVLAAIGVVLTLQSLLLARVACEFLIVIFQVAESLKAIERNTKGP